MHGVDLRILPIDRNCRDHSGFELQSFFYESRYLSLFVHIFIRRLDRSVCNVQFFHNAFLIIAVSYEFVFVSIIEHCVTSLIGMVSFGALTFTLQLVDSLRAVLPRKHALAWHQLLPVLLLGL
jgi:hypothetical protein